MRHARSVAALATAMLLCGAGAAEAAVAISFSSSDAGPLVGKTLVWNFDDVQNDDYSVLFSAGSGARKVSAGDDRRRAAQEATYRFMQAMAGNEAGFEDAARALFAGDDGRFQAGIARWPDDVREHVEWLATDAFVA